jgi:hypothetical protein
LTTLPLAKRRRQPSLAAFGALPQPPYRALQSRYELAEVSCRPRLAGGIEVVEALRWYAAAMCGTDLR